MKKAIYPGSFDPITNGHLDIINKVSKMVDNLHIVVFENVSKQGTFSTSSRLAFIKEVTSHLDNITIDCSQKLVVQYCKDENINVIIRGIRNFADFQNEYNLSIYNKDLNPDIETIFLAPSLKNLVVSSSGVKELLKFDQDISPYVPPSIVKNITKLFKREL